MKPVPVTTTCSRCRKPVEQDRKSRYCRACHAAYMRDWRPKHPLTGEARRRANARSYAKTYLRRGHLERLPCQRCGSPDSEMHHADYDKPLDVTWLCRTCHLVTHGVIPPPEPIDDETAAELVAMAARLRALTVRTT